MKSSPVPLTPRWCEHKDILRGWVILHKDVTHPRGLRHLRYIRLHCRDTDKTTYCRIFGPGKSKPYNEVEPSVVKESIFLDAHYQQKLEIAEEDMGNKKLAFDIEEVNAARYYVNAVCHHPDDSVRVGAFLGLLSIFLGFWSVYLSIQ